MSDEIKVETTKNEMAPVPPVAAVADATTPAVEAKPKKEKKAKEPKEPKAPRVQLPKQNGVTRPGGGVTGKVWEVADELSAAAGKPAARKEVMEKCRAAGIVDATIATQYGRWRTFHGLQKEAKAAAPAPEAAPAAETTPA